MTTIPFTPNSSVAPPFSATIIMDGSPYTLVARYNFYRGDWYISLIDQSGVTVITQPLIGSPTDSDIFLAPGVFQTSTLLYRSTTQNFEQSP